MFGSSKSGDFYPRVQFWIDSAQCAKTTGHYLVVCDPAGIERPIEDVSLADDRGHSLILSAVTRAFHIEPSLATLRTINLTINFFGFALFTWLLAFKFGWRSALFTALLGAYWIGGRAGPDVDAAYIGISLFALSAVFMCAREHLTLKLIASVFLLLSFVTLIRQPVGLGAALTVMFVAALTLKKANWLRSSLLVLAAFLSLKMASVPTAIRNYALGTKPAGTAAHGLTHNLFLGLGGFVDNKWGIVWDDKYAKDIVQKAHPEIQYCSDEYFDEIGRIYFSYVAADPKEAARVYLKKAGRVLSAAGPLTLPAFASLLIIAALILFPRRNAMLHLAPHSMLHPLDKQTALTTGAMALFSFSFLAQGILTHPAWTYVHPGPVILMICAAMIADRIFATCDLRPAATNDLSLSLSL